MVGQILESNSHGGHQRSYPQNIIKNTEYGDNVDNLTNINTIDTEPR